MKRTLSLLLVLLMLAALCCVGVSAEPAHPYVADGLVSLYSGTQNNRDGENTDATVWEDLVGTNDVTVGKTDTNYFTAEGYHLDTAQYNFPQGIVDTVNGNAFTVEILFGEFISKGGDFNTFLNSTNDNFALFRRNSNNMLEFKYAAVGGASRPTVAKGLETLQNALISITYAVGGDVIVYINGREAAKVNPGKSMGANDLYFGHAGASKCFETVFRSMRFYNRALTADEIAANAKADNVYGAVPLVSEYANIAQPTTHIIGDLALVRRVDTKEELTSIMSASVKPSTVILTFAADGNITDSTGKILLSAKDAVAALNNQVMPAFEVKTQAAADALAEFIKKNAMDDCFILSSNAALVKSVRLARPATRGILDKTADASLTRYTEAQLLALRAEARENFASLVLIPASLGVKEDVQYLEDRQTGVWLSMTDKPTAVGSYSALLSGAYGVVSDDTEGVCKTATTGILSGTLTRAPQNIGHRGLPSSAPENTLESAKLAYEKGANVIECDIYLTTDGQLVIMHDGNTSRTCDKNLTIESSSLAELKELYVNKGYENNTTYSKCRIPTLEEYYKEFKDKDVMIFVEIKSSKPEIVKALKALTDKYEMYDQINVITFVTSEMTQMTKDYPEMTVGYLCGGLMNENSANDSMRDVMNTIGSFGTSLNPSYPGYGVACLRAARLRGITIWPWTFGDLTNYTNYFKMGYSGLTGNNCDMLGAYVKSIELTGKTEGNTVTLQVNALNYLRATTDVSSSAKYTLLAGNDIAEISGNKLKVKGDGEVTVLASYTYTTQNRITYTVYDQPVTLTVKVTTETEASTEAPATESATEAATESKTDAVTAAPTTEAPTTNASGSNGCGSVVVPSLLVSLAVLTLGVAACKKHE